MMATAIPMAARMSHGVVYEPVASSTSPKMGHVDLVITLTLGTVWVIGEDAVDLYLVRFIERKTQSPTWRAIARSVLNPMRTAANVLRFKYPWYRDDLSR